VSAQNFVEKASRLRLLIGLQTCLRCGLRALWVGLGSGLAAWGLQQLTGWLPDPLAWWLLGLGAGLLPLVEIFFAWPKMHRLVWVLDRRFGMREQISTAWQAAHRVEPGELAGALIADANGLIDQLQARFLRRGWFLGRDLLSLLVVAFLAAGVYLNTRDSGPAIVMPEAQAVQALPPAAEQVSPAPEPTAAPEQPAGGSLQAALNTQDLMALVAAAQKMGKELSEIPETSQLGEALQQMDMQEAAGQMEELAEKAGDLSEETSQDIADAMETGGEELQASSMKELAGSLQSAQSAFEEGNQQGAAQSMQTLGASLQQLAQQFSQSEASQSSGQAPGDSTAAGEGPDPAQVGAASEFSRIEGGGGELELAEEIESADIPGSLKPGEAQEGGEQVVSGQVDAPDVQQFDPSQAVIVPYEYGWDWKNVVSRYFQPVQE